MIKEEIIEGRNLVKHWSDRALWMAQYENSTKIGEYPEAIDIIPCRFTYQEIEGKWIYELWNKEKTYMTRERVIYNEMIYESLVNNNHNNIPSEEGSEYWSHIETVE